MDQLGVTVNNTAATDLPNPSGDGIVTTYRLYPGGKVYTVQNVGTWLENSDFQPDPETNPLGFFQSNSSVSIRDNVSLRGALFVGGAGSDAYIYGANVRFEPVNLPPIDGASTPVQIPVLVVQDDLRVQPDASVSLQGMVTAGDEFEVIEGWQSSIDLNVQGRLLCQEFLIDGRLEWDQLPLTWQWYLYYFNQQRSWSGGEPYFPNWIESQYGLRQQPRICVTPPAQAATYHWHDAANPIYVAHPDDGGLRWDLIDWTENPPQ